MFMHADVVVQGVMLLLFLASVICWVIIFEKAVHLRGTGRVMLLFKETAAEIAEKIPGDLPCFVQDILTAGLHESRDTAGRESRSDYRERVERAMRQVLAGQLERLAIRVLFLATVGSTAPFVGLFGTVWGIMHSFAGIAATGETTLAVVAPGIAEALFATALGLFAAIPAIIAYNKINGSIKKITKEGLAGISLLGNHLAGLHYSSLEEAAAPDNSRK
jgi:biopolymer transport protein ExbB/TolQ